MRPQRALPSKRLARWSMSNTEHIAEEDRPADGEEMQNIIKEWGVHRETFSQQTASSSCLAITCPEKESLQQEEPMSLLSAQTQQYDDDEDLPHTIFVDLLLGRDSPQANGDTQHNTSNRNGGVEEAEDTESELAKELGSELYQDF